MTHIRYESKNLERFGGPWIPTFLFKNFDQTDGPWISSPPLKIPTKSTVRGSLNPYWQHFGTIAECHFRKQNPKIFFREFSLIVTSHITIGQ